MRVRVSCAASIVLVFSWLVGYGAVAARSSEEAGAVEVKQLDATGPLRNSCPHVTRAAGQVVEGVLAAAREYMRKNQPFVSFKVVEVRSLQRRLLGVLGTDPERKSLVQMCGEGVAEQSWRVTLWLPDQARTSAPQLFLYIVKTPGAWRVWYVPQVL